MSHQSIMSSGTREERTLLLLTTLDASEFDVEHLCGLAKGVDWGWVLSQAIKHRALPLLWDNIKRSKLAGSLIKEAMFPKIWAVYCHQMDWINREKNEVFSRHTEAVCSRLLEIGVRTVCLKGYALIGQIYHSGNRRMHDIDMLVGKHDIGAIEKELASLGFLNGAIDPNSGILQPMPERQLRFWRLYNHTLPYLYQETGVSHTPYYKLSIGFDFFDPSDSLSVSGDDVIARSVPKPGSSAFVPDHYDMILSLTAHIYREAVSETYAQAADSWSVMKFCDLRSYLLRFDSEIDRDLLRERIAVAGVATPYRFSLFFLDQIYGEGFYEKWALEIRTDRTDGSDDHSERQERFSRGPSFAKQLFAYVGSSEPTSSGWYAEFGREQW